MIDAGKIRIAHRGNRRRGRRGHHTLDRVLLGSLPPGGRRCPQPQARRRARHRHHAQQLTSGRALPAQCATDMTVVLSQKLCYTMEQKAQMRCYIMTTKEPLNLSMLCDFYELTMGNGYWKKVFRIKLTYFDVFFRDVPDKGGFAIAAGLEQVVDYIQNLHFAEEDIAYPPWSRDLLRGISRVSSPLPLHRRHLCRARGYAHLPPRTHHDRPRPCH